MADGTLGETPDRLKCLKQFFFCVKSWIGSNQISQIVRNFVHFLQTTLSPVHKNMYVRGTKFDVYETVNNQYTVFENREIHSKTNTVQNNALIEPVFSDIINP